MVPRVTSERRHSIPNQIHKVMRRLSEKFHPGPHIETVEDGVLVTDTLVIDLRQVVAVDTCELHLASGHSIRCDQPNASLLAVEWLVADAARRTFDALPDDEDPEEEAEEFIS